MFGTNRLIRVLKTCQNIDYLSSAHPYSLKGSSGPADPQILNQILGTEKIKLIQGNIIKDLTDASLIRTKHQKRTKKKR